MLRIGAPAVAHLPVERGRLNWDDARLFLEVASSGSFRKASELTGVSPNTIRRRIAALEERLGRVLLARDANGVRLTPEGREVARIAERLRDEASALERMATTGSRSLSGVVKVAVTEGLGTFWIIPRLVDFQRRHSGLTVDLTCDMRLADMASHQADVAVQLDPPTDGDLIVARLGYLHLTLFASDEYLRLNGVPTSVDDLVNHHVVEQIAPQVPSEMAQSIVANPLGKQFVSFRANTSTAHAYAISRGAGIGLLPTYARAITRRVRPINIDFKLRRDIWLVYHPRTRDLKRVKATIAWLREAFDANRYPWFGETFVPPDRLEVDFIDNNVIHLFEGFLERDL